MDGLTDNVGGLTERMGGLTERIDGLAAAQERTDQQLTRLATAQERTDGRMDQLTHRMDQLAESQQSMQRTFERFMVRTEEQYTSVRKEMREGYDQLDRRFDRLETKMDASFADVRKQLGGLSLSVGMGLEAYALDKIPRLLEMHCGFKTESVFPETFTDGGRTEKIDVVVRGSIASQPAVVVCEVKTNITQTEVRDFFGRVDRVRSRLGCDDVRVLFFGYRATPETYGMIEAAGGWLALPAGILRINRQAG